MTDMHWLHRFLEQQNAVPPFSQWPRYAPLIVQLASFAAGDAQRGRSLATRALLGSHGESEAIRRTLAMLPSRSKARSASSIASTETSPTHGRVLTVAARWHPTTRLILGLFVLGNVERDDLDDVTGMAEASRRVVDAIVELGDALDILPQPGNTIACEHVASRMIDADHPEHGREVRLHVLGCRACHAHMMAMQMTTRLLRESIAHAFPLPQELPAIDALDTSRRKVSTTHLRVLVLVGIAVALVVGLVRPTTRSVATSSTSLSAEEILNRALNRFDSPPSDGILHERYLIHTGLPLEIERFVGSEHNHFRLNITNTREHQPVLELSTEGFRLRYTVWSDGKPATTSVFSLRMPELLPLLRMLPEGGAIRSFPALHTGMDLDMIGAARRNGAALLGTAHVNDRRAYLLTFQDPEASQQIVLAIDTSSYTLLRATRSDGGAHARNEVLWQATTIEQLDDVPPDTFATGSGTFQIILPDPRHLTLGAFTNIGLADVPSLYGQVPVPTTIPTGTTFAYLRMDYRIGILQLYEGKQTTVALITTPPPLPSIPLRRLAFQTGDTYWDLVEDRNDMTHLELLRGGAPTRRTHLYVWHATMTAEERRGLAESVVRSIKWIPNGTNDDLGARFETVPDRVRR